MALGWSGSGGGIGELYKDFVKADVESAILKYESLIKKIPEGMSDIKAYYQEILQNFETLKDKTSSPNNLESKI